MKHHSFRGAGTALITPFLASGEVDYPALQKLVEFQIAGGIHYLVIQGTTGESPTLSADEKKRIVETVVQVNAGRVPLVLGVGGNDTRAVAAAMQHAPLVGIDAILSVAPYYNKPNQRGMVAHYKAVAENAPRPIIIYNVPGRTGANMLAETQLEIAGFDNIIGTKEASGNLEQCMQLLKHRPDNFLVISGDDNFTFPYLALGMDGVISVATNAFPAEMSRMVSHALAGEWEAARNLHFRLLDMMQLIFADGSPGGIKVMLNEAGICENVVRLPLMTVNAAVEERLRRLYRELTA
jgi:4-hydroxy-tetrahydrodipicolinate synthase